MARKFVAASNQYLYNANAVKDAVPLTMACWVKPADVSASYIPMSLTDTAGQIDYFCLQLTITTGTLVARTRSVGGGDNAETANVVTAGKWHHICGVWAATDDRKSYLDAGTAGTGTADLTPAGIDTTSIGAHKDSVILQHLNGQIAEAAIWDVALSTDEIKQLAHGMSPYLVNRANLLAYWPLTLDDTDLAGVYDLTAINSPTFSNSPPGIIYPGRRGKAGRVWGSKLSTAGRR